MLEPSITPRAWTKLSSPEFTKLTSITVVALLLWMIMVIKAPTNTAMKRLEVSFFNIARILFPAVIFIPSLIISIP